MFRILWQLFRNYHKVHESSKQDKKYQKTPKTEVTMTKKAKVTSSFFSTGDQLCFKVVMLGDAGVGKTCIVNRYVTNSYLEQDATMGSNYSSKVLMVQPESVIQPAKVKL